MAGVDWQRNKNRFAYHYGGKDRFYTPDFYIKTLDLYVEVKGYETDKDVAKWNQFPHKLQVVRKSEIIKIKNGQDFAIGK